MEEEEEEKEKPQEAPSLPVLPRLDRLDRLLNLLEEKHSMSSGRHLCNPTVKKTVEKEEDERISLSSALEEVHHKGTLMDRLATLENRVLQLSLVIDEGNTSRSSSSTSHVSKNILGHDLVMSKGSKHDHDEVAKVPPPVQWVQERPSDEEYITTTTLIEEVQERPSDEEYITTTTLIEERSGRKEKRKGYSKWIGWFRCGQDRHWNNDIGPNAME